MSSAIPSDSPLTDVQRAFLQSFFGAAGSDRFMLAGGTALAGFYLRHRHSDDIDLFTYDKTGVRGALRLVEEALDRSGLSLVKTRGQPGIDDSIFLDIAGDSQPQHPLKKIDIIVDTPPEAAPPEIFEGVRVMGVKDIAIAKLCAISRQEVKDFVDLFFLAVEGGIDLMGLLPNVKEKDPGLDELDTAASLSRVDDLRGVARFLDDYMIKPLEWADLRLFCRRLARDLVDLYPPPASGS